MRSSMFSPMTSWIALHVEIGAVERRVRRKAGLLLERVRIVADAVERELDVDGFGHAVQREIAVDRCRSSVVLLLDARARVARGRVASGVEELAGLDRVAPFRIAHVEPRSMSTLDIDLAARRSFSVELEPAVLDAQAS